MKHRCIVCGKEHDDLPHAGYGAPYQWEDGLELQDDSYLTHDLCVMRGEGFFVRGVVEIPVLDFEYDFGWGVWVSHKKENFEKYRDNFHSADIGPFFGWLCNVIEYYEESTLNLKTMAHYRGGDLRPRIEVEECDHPLYHQQQGGISLDEAWKIVHATMGPNTPP